MTKEIKNALGMDRACRAAELIKNPKKIGLRLQSIIDAIHCATRFDEELSPSYFPDLTEEDLRKEVERAKSGRTILENGNLWKRDNPGPLVYLAGIITSDSDRFRRMDEEDFQALEALMVGLSNWILLKDQERQQAMESYVGDGWE